MDPNEFTLGPKSNQQSNAGKGRGYLEYNLFGGDDNRKKNYEGDNALQDLFDIGQQLIKDGDLEQMKRQREQEKFLFSNPFASMSSPQVEGSKPIASPVNAPVFSAPEVKSVKENPVSEIQQQFENHFDLQEQIV